MKKVSFFLFLFVLFSFSFLFAEEEASSLPESAGSLKTLTVKGVEYRFRWCPAGTFTMGSPESEEGRWNDERPHRVTLTEGFWMMETEVTQTMWVSLMEDNPSDHRGGQFPVEEVSWDDCREFCEKFNSAAGLPDLKFSLPSEAQWEYACRAGDTSVCENLDAVAWYEDNCGEKSHEAGLKDANRWNLYDMCGNVWEWCSDTWDGESYSADSVTDPDGSRTGSLRICRGGSWRDEVRLCRPACRAGGNPAQRNDFIGFRGILR